MPSNLNLDYYYGSEAEQFSFYRVPKTLLTDPRYKSVSIEAKVLYGLLLDRMGLSVRNGWMDRDRRIYIYFTQEDAMTLMNCGKDKATKFSVREQLRQSKGVQRMVDIEAKKAQGKGVGYEHWATTFNLKQAAQALNIYTEYGFSSLEELDTAITAAFAEMQASADKLKPIENALKEKKELRRQISIYWATKPAREGLAAQKTKKAQAAYRQEHEADLLRSEAAVRFFKANGITKFPPKKKLTEEIEALMSEKNALYTEYQEKKQRANELLTVKRNIEQVLHGAPSQRRDEHDR